MSATEPVELNDATALVHRSPLIWLAAFAPEAVPADYAPYHSQLAAWPEPGTRQARVVFRGAAKSTVTTGLVLWAIHTGRTRGLVWVRAIGPDTTGDREALQRLGTAAGMTVELRAADQMAIVNGVPVWTKTPKGAVRGLKYVSTGGRVIRPDTAIIDDLETRETAQSQMQTDRLGRWLNADLFATAGHDAPLRVLMLGTPITPTCLIAKAMRREAPFDTWEPPMVVPYITDGQPAWPDVYDADLEARTEDSAWFNEYMLEPLPPGSLVFPPDRTRYTDTDNGLSVWIGVDPAGEGTDATGIVAAAYTPDGVVFVDAVQWNGHAEEGPWKVAELVRRLQGDGHTVLGVNVEAVGAWTWWANKVAELVAPVQVVYEAPVLSKLERALPLARWHKLGRVLVAEQLRGSPFDVELHTWTREGFTVTGHDDMVDAGVWAAGAATLGWSVPDPDPVNVDT